jgi:uncharacterized protein (DUF2384 family)
LSTDDPQPASGTAPSPARKRFQPRKPASLLDQAAAARQSRVATLAWAKFGSEAVAFLNTHHADLDARPIDLAVASADGLARVEAILAAVSSGKAATVA